MQQDEDRQLARVRDELVREFGAGVTEAVVDAHFTELVAHFDGAPVRTYVPVLTQRAARDRLRDIAGA